MDPPQTGQISITSHGPGVNRSFALTSRNAIGKPGAEVWQLVATCVCHIGTASHTAEKKSKGAAKLYAGLPLIRRIFLWMRLGLVSKRGLDPSRPRAKRDWRATEERGLEPPRPSAKREGRVTEAIFRATNEANAE